MNKTRVIAQGWVSYAQANDLKPNTKKYLERQHAYINGVSCILVADLPPVITIYAMTGRDIAELAQGQNSREISALALRRLKITWPDRFSRAEFHRAAEPLHEAAQLLVSKIATLHDLRNSLLRDISAKAGILREPTTKSTEQGTGAPHPAEVPAPRVSRTSHEPGWPPEYRRAHE